jgi:hypothetical protein
MRYEVARSNARRWCAETGRAAVIITRRESDRDYDFAARTDAGNLVWQGWAVCEYVWYEEGNTKAGPV